MILLNIPVPIFCYKYLGKTFFLKSVKTTLIWSVLTDYVAPMLPAVSYTHLQILALEKAGCEIIRCAVPNMDAAKAIGEIKKQIHIPLVADIHFDYKLAIAAIENGADKIRINPGNIGDEQRVRAVVEKAKEYGCLLYTSRCV